MKTTNMMMMLCFCVVTGACAPPIPKEEASLPDLPVKIYTRPSLLDLGTTKVARIENTTSSETLELEITIRRTPDSFKELSDAKWSLMTGQSWTVTIGPGKSLAMGKSQIGMNFMSGDELTIKSSGFKDLTVVIGG